MIKSVLFDLDGTLLDRDESVKHFIATQYDRLKPDLSHIHKSDYSKRFIELDCHGYVWKDKVYQTLVNEFKIEGLSWQNLLEDYETKFMFHCIPFCGLTQMLNTLKEQGYRLGIISNGFGEFQIRSIDGLGIKDYFDTILISGIEQVRKPQAEIFRRALSRLSVSANDSIFVGDHPEVDIQGARNAGLKAIWKRNACYSQPKEVDAIIDELNEIPQIIQELILT